VRKTFLKIMQAEVHPEKVWKALRTGKEETRQAVHRCQKLHEIRFHPNYIAAGKVGCIRQGCSNINDIARMLCEFRGWIFKSATKNGKSDYTVAFTCGDHTTSLNYSSLRLGGNCKKCKYPGMNNSTSNCECEVLRIGFRNGTSKVWICEHYNHAVIYSDSASEWDLNNPLNNGITPNMISPSNDNKYWFKCRHCKMPYIQMISNRVGNHNNQRCPYCSGQKACEMNCLATTHPDLAKEWDTEENDKKGIKITEVTYGSQIKVSWLCNKHKEKPEDAPFSWPCRINNRTSSNKRNCPKCNDPKYDQIHGGHEHFVKVSNKKHKNFYGYPEEYRGNFTKIGINCPKHGIFKQRPADHKDGQGCPRCAREQTESKPITELKRLLDELGIKYKIEEPFPGLIYKLPLWIDIYLPDFKLCIEFDGEQHFRMFGYENDEKDFHKRRVRDLIKDVYCVKNGLNLLRIPYTANITKELLVCVIDLCRSGQQYYFSYPEFIQQTTETLSETSIDLSKIIVSPINMPKH